MPVLLPDVGFQPAYPKVVESVSASRAGNRLVAMVEYADPFWQIDMRTVPLTAEERLLVEAFRDDCRGGLNTVIYTPRHQCLPRSHWGNPDAPELADGSLTSKSGSDAVLAATDGLTLSRGDLISLTTGDYHWMARIVTGGTVAGGSIAVTLNMAVPSYVAPGAVARFKDPRMNARMLPGSFALTDEFDPVASFTLVEVPK